MNQKKWLILLTLFVSITGCSTVTTQVKQIPKFGIVADAKYEKVANINSKIEKAILENYLSDTKVKRSSDDYKGVINSQKVSGGTVFLVRTKGGFFTFFVEEPTQKVLFVSGSESESGTNLNSPGGYSISPIRNQTKEFAKVFVGTYNFIEANKVVLTWVDGHQTTHQLTNGTLILELKENQNTIKAWKVLDIHNNSLYEQQLNT